MLTRTTYKFEKSGCFNRALRCACKGRDYNKHATDRQHFGIIARVNRHLYPDPKLTSLPSQKRPMHPVINIALRAARSAAEQIVHANDRRDRITVVSDSQGALVMNTDVDAERTILYHLQKAYPDFGVESRLSGSIEGKDKDNVWMIDPLVGNRNFYQGIDGYAVSIALRTPRGVSHAVLVNPSTGQEFTASKGSGARLNSYRMRISQRGIEQGFIGLDPDPTFAGGLLPHMQQQLLTLACHIRMSGCPALDMAYVAAGFLDGGWCHQQHPASLAAAQLIMLEAGALLSDPQGNPQTAGSRELIFGNPKCFKQLLVARQTYARSGEA